MLHNYSFLDTVTLIVQLLKFPFWKTTSFKAIDSSCSSRFSMVVHVLVLTTLVLGPRIFDTLDTFSSVGFSYWNSALDRCPDLSRINFSSTPALNREETQVTRKLWAVLRLKPADSHISGKIVFKLLMPTGTFSNAKVKRCHLPNQFLQKTFWEREIALIRKRAPSWHNINIHLCTWPHVGNEY